MIFYSIVFTLSFRLFKAASLYMLHKTDIRFFKLQEPNKLEFFDLNKNLLIQDTFSSYTFFKPKKNIFEIAHSNLKMNIPLILEQDINTLYTFLEKEQIQFEKPKSIGFWSIVELIFMP